jgi:hypothetical protein
VLPAVCLGVAIDVGPSCVAPGSPVPAYSMDELNTLVGFPEVLGVREAVGGKRLTGGADRMLYRLSFVDERYTIFGQ